jgi:hypothetical protein
MVIVVVVVVVVAAIFERATTSKSTEIFSARARQIRQRKDTHQKIFFILYRCMMRRNKRIAAA